MIGERLKKLRQEKKIMQTALATVLGVENSTISLYEKGEINPTIKILVAIADYFNISLDYLIGRIDVAVPQYDKSKFLLLPEMSDDDMILLSGILNYIESKNQSDV